MLRRHKKQTLLRIVLTCFIISWMPGCGILYVGSQDRTVLQTWDDNATRLKLSQELLLHDSKALDGVEVLVYQGDILLVGSVSSPELKAEAGKLAHQISPKAKIWNELSVGEESFSDYLSDTLTEKKIKASFIMDGEIKVENYTVRVFKGILYILGSASSVQELTRLKYYVNRFSLRDAKYFITLKTSKDKSK